MNQYFTLVLRNTFRHPLRTFLTTLGIAIALLAFFMIRTFLNAWHEAISESAQDRLVTRNAMSLVFPLPKSYQNRIAAAPGIEMVTSGSWFNGIYKDETFQFAQFAVDDNYLDVYSEFTISPAERRAYEMDRRGILVGRDLAARYQLKVGDVLNLKGTIYPGNWEFIVRGIFYPKDGTKDNRFMLFHYIYLNEQVRMSAFPGEADYVGYFAIKLAPGANTASVSRQIDALFANSFAETLTETETAFIQGFISMSSALLLAMNIISLVVIPIILLVLTNTMLMAARERYREYGIMRAIGFPKLWIGLLLSMEALVVSTAGFVLLCILVIPIFRMSAKFVLGQLASVFSKFPFDPVILFEAFCITILVGLFAGAVPYMRLRGMKLIDSLRAS